MINTATSGNVLSGTLSTRMTSQEKDEVEVLKN
jgi:hypothetical protein